MLCCLYKRNPEQRDVAVAFHELSYLSIIFVDRKPSAAVMSLAGKVAVVTGASKGIGKATALRLAKDGASVVINYSSDASSAEELVKTVGSDRAIAVQANVGKIPEIEKLVKQTVDKFGKIDILIANAAVAPNKDLEQTTEEDFDMTMELNIKGPYFLCQVSTSINSPGASSCHDADRGLESCTSHGTRLPHHPALHISLHQLRPHTKLPLVRDIQRRDRADASGHGQGCRPQRHLCECRFSRSDGHRAVL